MVVIASLIAHGGKDSVTKGSEAPATGVSPHELPGPTQEALFQAVGKEISFWQSVEIALSQVFAKLLSPISKDVCRTLFYTPRDFDTKLRIVHNTARAILVEPLINTWNGLKTRLLNGAEIRNWMAYFAATTLVTIEREPRNPGERIPVYGSTVDFYVIPNHQDPLEQFKSRGKKSLRPMTRADVDNAINEFTNLREELINLAQQISQRAAPR